MRPSIKSLTSSSPSSIGVDGPRRKSLIRENRESDFRGFRALGRVGLGPSSACSAISLSCFETELASSLTTLTTSWLSDSNSGKGNVSCQSFFPAMEFLRLVTSNSREVNLFSSQVLPCSSFQTCKVPDYWL